MAKMHIAVIGAGSAGICAAKYSLAHGFDVTVFEKTKDIGGTWVYTDQVEKDENGLDIHTSMYKGLRTISPKEVMGFPDYPITHKDNLSYITQQNVLDYLNSYADAFGVRKHVKFQQNVIRVRPIDESRWEVISENLTNKQLCKGEFDGILICNGHYNQPVIPIIDGQELYCGKQIHSHSYRDSEQYKGEKVLVVGVGVSGLDVAYQLSKLDNISVTLSYKTTQYIPKNYPEKIDLRPIVTRITETGAIFSDGTSKDFTVIIYCTGFKYNFPFLSYDCGLTCEENYVKPLFKHCININRPTMALIGLPFYVCPAPMFDIQVRFFFEYMSRGQPYPSKKEMEEDTEREMNDRWQKGYRIKEAHMMGYDQGDYWNNLAETAKIKTIPPVINKLFVVSDERFLEDYQNFRNDVYRIVDDYTFEKVC